MKGLGRIHSLKMVLIVASVICINMSCAVAETINFTVGSWLRYQTVENPSIEMKQTIIGTANLFGIDGIAIIEQEFIEPGDSEFEFRLVKEIDGVLYAYDGAMRVAILFRPGPIGTSWSWIEGDGDTEHSQIVGIEDVGVPAGNFSNCYHIVNWEISHNNGTAQGFEEIWWHPGTGSVKAIDEVGTENQQTFVLMEYHNP